VRRTAKSGLHWSKTQKAAYLAAMTESTADSAKIKALLKEALTDKINDREMFMKGVDYSYYYEEQSERITERIYR
jgi:cell filamentation protein